VSCQFADVAVVLTPHVVQTREQVGLRTGRRRRTHRPPRRIKTRTWPNVVEWRYLHVSEQRNHFQLLQKPDTHTHPFNGPFPGLPGWAGTRKVKTIWILVKQETVSGSGVSWAKCKSAARSRQITMSASHRSVFYRPDALPAAQPTASTHWRQRSRELYCKFTAGSSSERVSKIG